MTYNLPELTRSEAKSRKIHQSSRIYNQHYLGIPPITQKCPSPKTKPPRMWKGLTRRPPAPCLPPRPTCSPSLRSGSPVLARLPALRPVPIATASPLQEFPATRQPGTAPGPIQSLNLRPATNHASPTGPTGPHRTTRARPHARTHTHTHTGTHHYLNRLDIFGSRVVAIQRMERE